MPYIGRTPTNAALTASDLADGIVTTAKIDADAVTDAKIADDVVGTEHLTANEVDTAALGADAVTGAQLADNAVNSEHYTDGSIDTAHIADNQITLDKLAGGTDGNIISYDASGDPVAIATGSDGQVLTSTGAGSPPAFEALPSSGGLVLISNTTISSTGTLDINGIFSATYQNYRVIGSNLKCATDNSDWTFQLRTSSAVQGSSYYWAGVGQRGAGSAIDDGDTNGGNFKILRNTANDTASTNFDMTLFQPNVANVSKNYSCVAGGRRQDDTAQVLTCSGFLASDTVFTGLRFLANQGNITAGNILVFGIKDS